MEKVVFLLIFLLAASIAWHIYVTLRAGGLRDLKRMHSAKPEHFGETLAKLAKSQEMSDGNIEETARLIAKEGCIALDTYRVRVWNYDTQTHTLKCLASYNNLLKEFANQENYSMDGVAGFDEYLATERVIVINSTSEAASASGYSNPYDPEVCAVLFAPIRIDRIPVGIVCVEQDYSVSYPKRRDWSIEEQSFVSSLSDFMEIAITNAERQKLMQRLSEELSESKEVTKLMLDSGPICCQIWSRDLQIIDCNEAAVNLYGFKDKQEYMDRWLGETSPEYQPDGQLSREKAMSMLKKAFSEGRCVFDWMHQTLDGTPLPTEITLVRVKHMGTDNVVGYTRDMRQHMKLMREIDEYTGLLQLLNKMSTTLLQAKLDDFEVSLHWCANTLAAAMQLNRVRVWQNHTKDGKLYCTELFEWSEGAISQFGNEYTVEISYDDVIPGWEDILSHGGCINEMVRDLTPVEQAQIMPQGVLSILVVPIFLQNRFWGFTGYDDCQNERRFSEKEVAILRSASQLIAIVLNRNEEAEKAKEAEDMAYHDALTGLFNRRYLDENLNRMIQSLSRRPLSVLSLMLVDIDHFKLYNDTYGHDEGDKCLKIVADVLQSCITRADDFIVRYGGEEFAVVLPNTDEDGARLIAEGLLNEMRSREIPHSGSPIADYVTFSIGIATDMVHHEHEGSEYIRRADEMLYKSKQEGRNRYNLTVM